MTQLLEEAIQEVRDLDPVEQDRIAGWLLAELKSERRWEVAFASSTDQLEALAAMAISELKNGRTLPLEIPR